jgi:hypothetical protein
MDQMSGPSSDVLLARLNYQVEKISNVQHRLARKKALMQEQITRLRLGVSPAQVRVALRAISAPAPSEPERRWRTVWPGLPLRARTDRDHVGSERP